MNQRQSQPASSGRRQHQAQGKAARPGVHRRVHSYQNTHSQATANSKAAAGSTKKAPREQPKPDDDEEDCMAGLPQFCTTCDRQIIHPSQSTLYCSRACQRKDSAKPAPIEPVTSPAFISAPSYFDVPQPDILPQRSPTVLRPLSLTFSETDFADSASTTTDDDDADRLSYSTSRYHSHPDLSDPPSSPGMSRRPHPTRSSTSTLPSLSNTPSSSVGTAASFSSYRPFPPRHDPLGGHRGTKSADLVIPTFAGPSSVDGSAKSSASTLTSFHAVEAASFHAAEAGDVTYAKQSWKGGSARGSLRQLFGQSILTGAPSGGKLGYK